MNKSFHLIISLLLITLFFPYNIYAHTYLPYGNVYEHLFSQNRYDYTGKELDEDTGLHYYGARYYNSKLGRFMSVDPVGGNIFDPQSFNKYLYVLNNPFKYVDPNGESPCDVASVFGGLAGQITGGTADLLVAYGKIGIRDSEFIYLDAIRTTFEQFETITSLCGFRGLGVSTVKLGVKNTGKVGRGIRKFTKSTLTPEQVKNLERFNKKLPANSSDVVVRDLPGGGKVFQADSAARNIPGSFARFEKQVDSSGTTTKFTITTFGSKGEIIQVKDKITGQIFIPGK